MNAGNTEVGACILLLDFPPGNEIGIDFKTWKIGARFRGIRNIPRGLHLIYSSSVDKHGQVGIRSGFFQHFENDSVIVRKWDPLEEIFVDGPTTQEDQQRFRDNLYELATYLGPYPQDLFPKWVAHSCHITPNVVSRILPDNRLDSVPAYVSPASNTAERRQKAIGDQQSAEDSPQTSKTEMQSPNASGSIDTDVDAILASRRRAPLSSFRNDRKESKLLFSNIQLRTYPSGCSASEISQHMLDKSYALNLLMESYKLSASDISSTSMLLGELQFAFIAFILCNDFMGFEQWKLMVSLLCRCPSMMASYSSLFEEFIGTLYHQVGEIPEDFLTDIVSSENFLIDALHAFFASIETCGEDCSESLRRKADGFQQFLLRRFGWDFKEEGEEDKPVLVDCTL